jgi:hypothetical protein
LNQWCAAEPALEWLSFAPHDGVSGPIEALLQELLVSL